MNTEQGRNGGGNSGSHGHWICATQSSGSYCCVDPGTLLRTGSLAWGEGRGRKAGFLISELIF